MKKLLLVTSLTCGLVSAMAQGTFQFTANLNGANEVPPNGSPGFGSGTLTLSGTTLSYLFTTSIFFQDGAAATDVTLNGPAGAGSTAPVLFDLGAPTLIPMQPPPGAYYSLPGTIDNLTSGQINDLSAGLWYVNVFTSSANYPGGEIRGQILPVPEPGAGALAALGGGLILLARQRPKQPKH